MNHYTEDHEKMIPLKIWSCLRPCTLIYYINPDGELVVSSKRNCDRYNHWTYAFRNAEEALDSLDQGNRESNIPEEIHTYSRSS